MKTIALVFLCLLFTYTLFSQISCDTGSEPECMCETAEILCSVVDLNGFQGGMSSFQHPADGPDDFCPSQGNTVSDNPTWFAFIAWCEDIDMTVTLDNCQPGGNNGQWLGAQIAVFPNCTTNNSIDCDSDCNISTPHDMDLSLDNLNIGQVYYFMIDGCGGSGNGSTCDYTIAVSPTDCDEEIEEWTNGISGETSFCIGEMETYTVDDLDGATSYHWYIDGSEVSVTDNEDEIFTWDTEGEYDLCVDVSNECVELIEDPMEICTTIVVAAPDAGVLTATPNTLCPDEISTVTLSSYNANPIYDEYLIVTEPDGTVIDAVLVGNTTIDVTYDECGTVKVYSLNFATEEMVPVPAAGDNYTGSDCVANCCDEICELILFEDTTPPMFTNAPADITLDCFDLLPAMQDQEATDDCLATEMITGVESGSADLCDGGTITREWVQVDNCDNMTTHVQTITISPTPVPAYVNSPLDQNINCDGTIPAPIDLVISNGVAAGGCQVDDVVSPTVQGVFDLCGSVITYEWDYTDACNNNEVHMQTITISPADPPAYINPPADVSLTCNDVVPSPIDLTYTNNLTGVCLIENVVTPTVIGSPDPCGSDITYTWVDTDPCGLELLHTQTITIEPAPVPAFVSPPADVTISCSDVVPSPIDLLYTNGVTGACLVEDVESPVISGATDPCGATITYEWEYTDACNNTISHIQNIEIDPVLVASFINPPADITFSCAEYESYTFVDLDYTNNEVGACLIDGAITPVITDNTLDCQGTIVAFYEFVDDCGRVITQTQVITLESPAEAAFINGPADVTVSCDVVSSSADPLGYTNGEMGGCLIEGTEDPMTTEAFDACGGTITHLWEYLDDCNRLISYIQVITVEPAVIAAFNSMPADITMTCDEFDDFSPDVLSYTNGESGSCLIDGTEQATTSDVIDECGGTITYDWEFLDDCNRLISHSQTITVDPAPAAVFLNVPADVTLDCSDASSNLPFLAYNNGESGVCQIAGNEQAIASGNVDECGGVLTLTWSHTDLCSRTISESQTITYEPAPEPEWMDTPADITVGCEDDVPDPEDLEYDNFESDPCDISGTVAADVDIVDNFYTYTWEFTNSCSGNTIIHTQVLTKLEPVELEVDEFEFSECLGFDFDLEDIDLVDINGSTLTLSYHDDDPPNDGNEISSLVTLDEDETTYYILAENDFGCGDVAEVILTSFDLVNAGDDFDDDFCVDEAIMDLYAYLDHTVDIFGEFTQLDGPEDLDLIDASQVNVTGVGPGIYLFLYTVESDMGCPSDEAEVEIEIYPSVHIDLISIECDPGGDTYTVVTTNMGYDFDANAGDVDEEIDTVVISNIPIDRNLDLYIWDDENRCENEFFFTAPDCSCPTVDSPVSIGDQRICIGDPIPALSVTVGADAIANWYDAVSAGQLLQANSLSYSPIVTSAGIYTFYAEAESTLQPGCVSATRTPVGLEVIAQPAVKDTFINFCELANSSTNTLSKLSADNTVFGGLSNLTATYYLSESDRIMGVNPVVFPFALLMSEVTLFVSVENAASCKTVVSLDVITHPLPELSNIVTDETCFGYSDGMIALTVDSNGLPYEISLRNEVLTMENLTNLEPGIFTFSVIDSLSCTDTLRTTVGEGTMLSFDALDVSCDDNDTSSEPDDDTYTITFSVLSSIPSAAGYTLSILPDNLMEVHDYNEVVTLIRPANNEVITLTATDITNDCSTELILPALLPCSSDCSIIMDLLEYTCNNNGTGLDPLDDVYDITISASSINGSAANTYNVIIDGVVSYSFSYDVNNSFSLPANSNSYTIAISDSQFNGCESEMITDVLEPCSDDCLLEATIISNICNNANTPTIAEDDLYSISIMIESINGSLEYMEQTSGMTGNYSDPFVMIDLLITDGPFALTFVDSEDSTCELVVPVDPPLSCSEPCTTELNSLVVSDCDDNGTPDDNGDDFYSATITVGDLDGIVSGVTISDNLGNNYGPFNYNSDIFLGPYSANGEEVELIITDATNGSCLLQETISQAACSDACMMTATLIETPCTDGGTSNTFDDDMYTISFIVEGINVSPQGYMTNLAGVGQYSTQFMTDEFLIADGNIQLVFTDIDNAACMTILDVPAPDPCSEACMIEAIIVDVPCSNGGTLDSDEDDLFSVSYIVEGVNVSPQGYTTNIAGVGEYNIENTTGEFLISDGDIQIVITDEANGACVTILDVSAPGPCSSPCQLEWSSFDLIPCSDGGTSSDPSDDFFAVNFTVSVLDGMTSDYIVMDNLGNSYGPFGYGDSIELGPFVANNTTVTLTIVDSTNPSCMLEESISSDSCSDECVLDLTILSVVCDFNGTTDTSLDDLYDVTFIVEGTNASEEVLIDELGITVKIGEPYTLTGSLIIDGPISYTVVDSENVDCQVALDLVPTASCSDPCEVTLESAIALDCMDNMTGDTADDDFYFLEVNIAAGIGAGDDYFLSDGQGNTYGPFLYDRIETVGPLAADGEDLELVLVDDDNGNCAVLVSSNVQPCSMCSQVIDIAADTETLSCQDPEAILSAVYTELPVSFEWSGQDGFLLDTETITVTVPDSYNLLVTYADGCTAENTIVISADDDIPTSSLGPDVALDCDNMTVTLTLDNSSLTANTLVEWLDENGQVISTADSYEVDSEGTYGLLLTDTLSGCQSQVEQIVVTENFSVPQAVIYAEPDSLLNCFIESINLSHVIEPNVVYTWLVNGEEYFESTFLAVDSAEVNLIAVDTISSCDNSSSLTIEDLTAYPIIELGDLPIIDCVGGQACISVTSPTTNNLLYEWTDEDGTIIQSGQSAMLCVDDPGDYNVILTDVDNDCSNDMPFSIEGPAFPQVVLPEIIALEIGEVGMLSAEINLDLSLVETIVWITEATLSCYDCIAPEILSFEDGDAVTLVITTDEGCEAIAVTTISIQDINTPKVYIPNVISPDITGNFTIYSSEEIEIIQEFYIYDRWGNLVFSNENFMPSDQSEGWDGRINNVSAEQGVYVYLFVYEIDGRLEYDAGDVTLIR